MSRKEIVRLLDHIEPQGVTYTRTTKGVLLRLPDKTTAMLHWTGSDVREPKNVRARLKRAGVTWPGDDAPLPDYITEPPTARTLNRVQTVTASWEQRYITGGQLNRLLRDAGDKPMNSMTSQRALYALGWVPTGKSTARKWLRPLELEPEPIDATPEDLTQLQAVLAGPEPEALPVELQAARAAVEAMPEPVELRPAAHAVAAEQLEHPAPVQLTLVQPQPEAPMEPMTATVREHPAGREFIDTADSWTGNLDELPEGYTLAQLRQLLGAFGLQLELRVWRSA